MNIDFHLKTITPVVWGKLFILENPSFPLKVFEPYEQKVCWVRGFSLASSLDKINRASENDCAVFILRLTEENALFLQVINDYRVKIGGTGVTALTILPSNLLFAGINSPSYRFYRRGAESSTQVVQQYPVIKLTYERYDFSITGQYIFEKHLSLYNEQNYRKNLNNYTQKNTSHYNFLATSSS